MLTERFSQAITLAIEAHTNQKRKGTEIPYISHPLGVASIALEYGADEDQAMAALLHDAIEDGGQEYAQRIRLQFGDRVANIVEGCTDGVPNANGVKDHLKHASEDVLLVSGSDKLHNARAIVDDLVRIGPAVFDRFTASQEQTLWYYDSLSKIFTERKMPFAKTLMDTVYRMKILAN